MCNDRSWKSCSIVTIVFTTMLMLGMFISVGVMNSMFGDNMQCYVDATNDAANSRRQMVEGMDKIAAQHPSGDGIAAGKLALFNIAQTFGLGPAVKQLPAFRSLAPEGRKLAETYVVGQRVQANWLGQGTWRDAKVTKVNSDNTYDLQYDSDGTFDAGVTTDNLRTAPLPPNDNSCASWNLNDNVCDDTTYGACECGTDLNDCGNRMSSDDCATNSGYNSGNSGNSGGSTTYHSAKTAEESVAEAEKAVLDVFNPAMIVPAIFCALFLYIGSALTLANPVKFSCGGKGMLITSNILTFPSFIIYAIGTYFLLIAANIYVEIIKTSFNTAVGTDDHVFTKCLDDSRAMFSSAGVGCLIACIGCLGAFISAIFASCGICKHETKQKQAALPVPGTQPGTQMTNIAVATPVIATPV